MVFLPFNVVQMSSLLCHIMDHIWCLSPLLKELDNRGKVFICPQKSIVLCPSYYGFVWGQHQFPQIPFLSVPCCKGNTRQTLDCGVDHDVEESQEEKRLSGHQVFDLIMTSKYFQAAYSLKTKRKHFLKRLIALKERLRQKNSRF